MTRHRSSSAPAPASLQIEKSPAMVRAEKFAEMEGMALSGRMKAIVHEAPHLSGDEKRQLIRRTVLGER